MILRHAQMQIGFKGEYTESVRCANMRHGTRRGIKIPPVSVQKSVKWKIMSSFRHYLKRYWHIIIKNLWRDNMSYPNAYLRDFVPVLGQILKEKQIAPEKLHLEIIDEESEEKVSLSRWAWMKCLTSLRMN